MEAEDSGRLYVDFSTTQAQKTTDIISRPEVRRELQLTATQLAQVAAWERQQPRDVPSLTNLLAQSRASKSVEDRKKFSNELWERFAESQRKSLFALLSASQSNRLQQIEWQVDGLKSLRHDHALAADLGLSEDQLAQVRGLFLFYQPILSPLYQRLGRQMVAGLSADETTESRREQVQSIAGAVTAIEKERDRDLRRILTLPQRDRWRRLVGKPIQLHWELKLF